MTFLQRIRCYCQEQLEPGPRLFVSIVVGLLIELLVRRQQGLHGFGFLFLVPSLGTFFLLLYYRISDEFKDRHTDAEFFPERPLPSGRLKLEDLTVLLILVSVLGGLVNLISPFAWVEYTLAFTFTALMGKWFFMEKVISRNRLLAFVTHAPVGIFLYWYAVTYLLRGYGIDWEFSHKMSLIGFIVLPGLSWEVLRKTYLPEDERPGYQVYSSILGLRGALLFAGMLVLITLINNFFLTAHFASLVPLNGPLLVVNLGLIIVIASHAMKPRMKNLKPVAEIYMALHLFLPLLHLGYGAYVSR